MSPNFKGESGSVTTLVAVFTSALVLLASIVFAVDAGIIYVERRTVVNAAQSAALALSRECIVEGMEVCSKSSQPQLFANLNSSDGLTQISSIEICVNGKLPTGLSCQPTRSSNSLNCNDIDTTKVKNYVRVRTESISREPGIGLRTFFSTEKNLSLIACAQVKWGNAESAPVYSPFAVSICEWSKRNNQVGKIEEFKPSSSNKPDEIDCQVSLPNLPVTVMKGISGWAAIDLTSDPLPLSARAVERCLNPNVDQPANLSIGMKLSPITEDIDAKTYCGDSKLVGKMSNWLGREIYIPLISTEKLQGNRTVHTIRAFAEFRLLGYSLKKDKSGQVTANCNTNCIYGEFISTLAPDSEVGDSIGYPNVGLQAIELS